MWEVMKSSVWKSDPSASNRLKKSQEIKLFPIGFLEGDSFSGEPGNKTCFPKDFNEDSGQEPANQVVSKEIYDEISNLRPNFLITKAQTNCGYYFFYSNDRIFFIFVFHII